MSHSVLRNNTANHPENEPNMPESLKTSKALKAEQSTSADSSQSPFSGTTGAPKWNKTDLTWMLSLFGTAIGAGCLVPPHQRRHRRHHPAAHHDGRGTANDLLGTPWP